MASTPSLDDFAAGDATRPGTKSRIERLDPDIQAQILTSTAGHSVVARWLQTVAPEAGISQGMVMHFRHNHGWARD